ncbi:PEP-CTERM sorting domain-containing protein [Nostoc sp. 106C]|uniref:PEP-CTERM sorting domain-containing protein n=1 Tax=Nostoc sp. 106C TaxID=1932667 RepID=UPI000A386169|nr:PEP-CTERM sorting domain-containing protein [Nostoc sp. 106C]OUL26156.1 hypothetical protein BV378_13600 [Nostoc sp. RF31YmG]OUL31647.1 hypothetical protein BV375_11850 [Nostoc sp. 106C]
MSQLNILSFCSQKIAKVGLSVIAGVGSTLLLSNPLYAATLGNNLIVNGDAEQGVGDSVGNVVSPNIPVIPGWTATSDFSVLKYGATGFDFVNPMGNTVSVSGLPDANNPGPSNRGLNLFYGGGSRASSSASQLIDVSNLSSIIDAGKGGYDLSAWLGGYETDADNVKLSLDFLNQNGQSLGTAFITSPTAEERNNTTALLFKYTTGFVPVSAREIKVVLDMNYVRGRVNDGYADNLSLVIKEVPEPSMSGSLILGGCFILALRLRRNRPLWR